MKIKNIVVTETYTDRDGNPKKKYTTIGTLFMYDDGGIGVKMDMIPVGWNGKANAYDKETRPADTSYEARPAYQPPNDTPPPMPEPEPEIPF